MRARHGGFLVMENVIGLALLGVLIVGLAASVYQYTRAQGELAGRRIAMRRAELVLALMQTGKTAGLDDPDMRIALRSAQVPTAPPTGFVWAEVKVEYEQQEAVLIGLVPRRPFEQTAAESKGKP